MHIPGEIVVGAVVGAIFGGLVGWLLHLVVGDGIGL